MARSVQRQRGKQAAGWVYEGDIELAQKNYGAAAAAYRTALAKEKAPDIAVKLYRALSAGGHATEAGRFVAEMDKASPRDSAFQMYLADEALARGEFAAAEVRYRAAVSIQARNAAALNNLAYVLVKQGKEGAVALSEKANELMPGKPVLMDTLAMALAGERQFDRAISTQKMALELEPSNGNLRLNLARIYILAGDKVHARTNLEALNALGNAFTNQAEVANLLQSIR